MAGKWLLKVGSDVGLVKVRKVPLGSALCGPLAGALLREKGAIHAPTWDAFRLS